MRREAFCLERKGTPSPDVTPGGATNNFIEGNIIGMDETDRVVLGNGLGIGIDANDNTIGGTQVGSNNVISGNSGPRGPSSDVVLAMPFSATQSMPTATRESSWIRSITPMGGNDNLARAGAYEQPPFRRAVPPSRAV